MLRRRRKQERREPSTETDALAHLQVADAPARWRPAVDRALGSRARFQELVAMADAGPIRDRIEMIGRRIDRGVETMWSLVQQGAVAERAVSVTDPDTTADRLKAARRQLAAAEADGTASDELTARVEALSRSHAAAQRLCNSVEDLGHQLDVINARLEAAVAHAAELVVGGLGDDAADAITRELDDALIQLEATRRALSELDQL